MPTLLCISGCMRTKKTFMHSSLRPIWGMQVDSSPAAPSSLSITKADSQPCSCLLCSNGRQMSPLDLPSCRGHMCNSPRGTIETLLTSPNHIPLILSKKSLEKFPTISTLSSHYINFCIFHLKKLYFDLTSHLRSLSFEFWCFKWNLIDHLLTPILNSSSSTYELV